MAKHRHNDDGLIGKDGKVVIDQLIRSAGEAHVERESDLQAFLAGELNKMSIQERQKVFEEIHGVAEDCVVEETPDFVAGKLAELEQQVALIEPREAYDLACQINPYYVQDESFRLTFLRADLFDAVKAAKRMITFFECRLALFGPGLLTRALSLDDLDKDDMATLKSGYFQILASRDTAGRAVLVNVQGMFKRSYKLALNMQRMYHYLHCSMAEDLETQRRGYVFVMYQIGSFEYDPPPDLFNGNSNLFMQGSPIRICGMHSCFDHPVMKAISRVVITISGKEARARNRFHEGSHTEVQYKLLSFGIPVDLLPITATGGGLKKTDHMKWLAMRKAKESTRSSLDMQQHFASSLQLAGNNLRIDLPGRNDVLMGKGKPVQDHAGNVAMRTIVSLYLPEYDASIKHKKVNYVHKVRAMIESKKGRFLKKDTKGGWWILATEEEAKDKVGKTFTSLLSRSKRNDYTKNSVHQILQSQHFPKRLREDKSKDKINISTTHHWGCFGFGCDKRHFDHATIIEADAFQMPKRRK